MHWARGIIIAFVLFIGFILSMVVQMSTQSAANHELVTEEYYKKERDFERIYAAKKRGLDYRLEVKETGQGLQLKFAASPPDTLEVFFYRPANQKLDFKRTLSLDDTGIFKVSNALLVTGRYVLQVRWKKEQLDYIIEQTLDY